MSTSYLINCVVTFKHNNDNYILLIQNKHCDCNLIGILCGENADHMEEISNYFRNTYKITIYHGQIHFYDKIIYGNEHKLVVFYYVFELTYNDIEHLLLGKIMRKKSTMLQCNLKCDNISNIKQIKSCDLMLPTILNILSLISI